MDGRKVVGIDGTTKDEYEENLDENLRILVLRLKNQSYKPKPAKRVDIPKDNGKTNYILDADIKGFFDKLTHEWILKFVMSPITNSNIIRLVEQMLKGES